MNEKPTIIFDLGAVLIDWNPRYLYRKLFASEDEMEQFFSVTGLFAWNARQDGGHSMVEAVAELSAQHPQYENYIRAFWDRWEEMLAGAIDDTVNILASLKDQDYELYALSNWSHETYPVAQARFEFLRWFKSVVISGELKICKPDPRIYEHILGLIGRPARECVFIDDSQPNVVAAQQLGLQTIHFHSPEQLQTELRGLGI